MNTKTINKIKNVTINYYGDYKGNTKPVMCLDNGDICNSAKEFAEKENIPYANFSRCARDGVPAPNGKQYCYVGEAANNPTRIAEALQEKVSLQKEIEQLKERLEEVTAVYEQAKGQLDSAMKVLRNQQENARLIAELVNANNNVVAMPIAQ